MEKKGALMKMRRPGCAFTVSSWRPSTSFFFVGEGSASFGVESFEVIWGRVGWNIWATGTTKVSPGRVSSKNAGKYFRGPTSTPVI